jgi:hypothetical protein
MLRSPLVTFASMCGSPLSSFARGLKELAAKGGMAETPAPAPEATKTAEEAPPADTAKETPKVEEITEETEQPSTPSEPS